MRYPVIAWKEEGMWTVHAPAVLGAYGVGKTPREAQEDLAEALETLTVYLREIGQKMPRPGPMRTGYIEV